MGKADKIELRKFSISDLLKAWSKSLKKKYLSFEALKRIKCCVWFTYSNTYHIWYKIGDVA